MKKRRSCACVPTKPLFQSEPGRKGKPFEPDMLTDIQLDIARQLARGLSFTEIARNRGRSPYTIKCQVQKLLKRYSFRSRNELVDAIRKYFPQDYAARTEITVQLRTVTLGPRDETLPALRPWQQREIDQYGTRLKHAILADPRMGKTRAAAEELAHAMSCLQVTRGLIVCPTDVEPVWLAALRAVGIQPICAWKMPIVKIAESILTNAFGDAVLIINQEKIAGEIAGPGSTRLCDVLRSWEVEAYIRDESHRDKDPNSAMGKASRKIAIGARWVRILTGTPSPNRLEDLWGQMALLDRSEWGRTMAEFRKMSVAEIQEKLLRFAHIVRREDEFGADDWQPTIRDIDLPARARAIYDRLADQYVTELQAATSTVSALHVLKRLTRLQQITSGFLPDDQGAIHLIHDAKVRAVLADLGEIVENGEKAVIYHRFRWESDVYAKRIAAELGCPTYVFSGATKATREAQRLEFQGLAGGAVMVAQTKAAALGIDLNNATHALFVSQGWSFADEKQARDRIWKEDSPRCVSYYRARNSVDHFIASVVEYKRDIHDAIRHADCRAMMYGLDGLQPEEMLRPAA
jgi:DNA-binding CsgD family transcriptional regulator